MNVKGNFKSRIRGHVTQNNAHSRPTRAKQPFAVNPALEEQIERRNKMKPEVQR